VKNWIYICSIIYFDISRHWFADNSSRTLYPPDLWGRAYLYVGADFRTPFYFLKFVTFCENFDKRLPTRGSMATFRIVWSCLIHCCQRRRGVSKEKLLPKRPRSYCQWGCVNRIFFIVVLFVSTVCAFLVPILFLNVNGHRSLWTGASDIQAPCWENYTTW